jgi:hypothetical protein
MDVILKKDIIDKKETLRVVRAVKLILKQGHTKTENNQ